MKKILAGAVSGAAALAVIFGAGPASADNEYKGLTFAQVQERTGGRAVISSRTGSYLPTEECVVTGNRRATYGDSSGNRNSKILVDLNCNDTMTAGHPGYSVASEQGKKAKQLKDQADSLSAGFARRQELAEAGRVTYCERGDAEADACRQLCLRAGTCSQELLQYLGL